MPADCPRRLISPLRFLGASDRHPPVRSGYPASSRRPLAMNSITFMQERLSCSPTSDADRLGHAGLRLRPPLPRRVGTPVPSRRGPPVPDAGHYVLEDEAEEIMPLVQSFLAAHPVVARRRGLSTTSAVANIAAGLDRDGRRPTRCAGRRLPRRPRPCRPRRLHPLDLPAARHARAISLARGLSPRRHRARRAHRADGQAEPGILRPHVRPVQGRAPCRS